MISSIIFIFNLYGYIKLGIRIVNHGFFLYKRYKRWNRMNKNKDLFVSRRRKVILLSIFHLIVFILRELFLDFFEEWFFIILAYEKNAWYVDLQKQREKNDGKNDQYDLSSFFHLVPWVIFFSKIIHKCIDSIFSWNLLIVSPIKPCQKMSYLYLLLDSI